MKRRSRCIDLLVIPNAVSNLSLRRLRSLALRGITALSLLSVCLPAVAVSNGTLLPYPHRTEVQQFIEAAVVEHGFERAWLERALSQARYSEAAERLTTPGLAPPWTRNWLDYRARIVDDKRIQNG